MSQTLDIPHLCLLIHRLVLYFKNPLHSWTIALVWQDRIRGLHGQKFQQQRELGQGRQHPEHAINPLPLLLH